jgi:hypothetical protein
MSKPRHVSGTYYGIYQNKSFNDNDILTWHITDLVCREDRPNQGNTRLRMSLSRDYTLWFVLSNVVLCNVVNSYSRSNRQDILKMNIYYVSVNQNYPIWPPNPRWPPYDCSYLGIHQYKTPYCSNSSMKLHAYVLYVPCDTLQIISYINVSKMAAKYIMATKNSMYRISHFHICMSTINTYQ